MTGADVGSDESAAADALGTTRDTITVAAWTAVSRVTGLVRVAAIAAVLGPTYLGNAYQFTNSVPNLVYYGLLGGALVSSLLVPVLVRHIAAAEPARVTAVARGFLGCATGAAVVAVPVVGVVVPLVLRATNSAGGRVAQAQIHAAIWLVVMLAPQIVCYAVIACSVAVMNAHRRFAVAAAAPTIENVGSLVVLGAVLAWFGSGREVSEVDGAELALLGLGTTAAVVVHAAVQWRGARRCGVTLVPQRGWRDPEVRAVATSSGWAIGQAGLWAIQLIVAMSVANRFPGGVVAVLIATNFFFLPVALVATPVALAALPRLARFSTEGRRADYDAAVERAVSLTLFATAPAAVGYLVLAPRLDRVIRFGSMTDPGAHRLIEWSLAGLAPGVVGTGLFTVATYASYARGDARSPMRAMAVQTVVAIAVMLVSPAISGRSAIVVVTGALALGGFVGAGLLLIRLRPADRARTGALRSARRTIGCAVAMAPVTWGCDRALSDLLPSHAGQAATLVVTVCVGAATYLLAQRLAGSAELSLLSGSIRRRRRPVEVVGTGALS